MIAFNNENECSYAVIISIKTNHGKEGCEITNEIESKNSNRTFFINYIALSDFRNPFISTNCGFFKG